MIINEIFYTSLSAIMWITYHLLFFFRYQRLIHIFHNLYCYSDIFKIFLKLKIKKENAEEMAYTKMKAMMILR